MTNHKKRKLRVSSFEFLENGVKLRFFEKKEGKETRDISVGELTIRGGEFTYATGHMSCLEEGVRVIYEEDGDVWTEDVFAYNGPNASVPIRGHRAVFE